MDGSHEMGLLNLRKLFQAGDVGRNKEQGIICQAPSMSDLRSRQPVKPKVSSFKAGCLVHSLLPTSSRRQKSGAGRGGETATYL